VTEYAELEKAFHILDARERLRAMEATSYPKIKEEDQKKLHRDLHRQAYPDYYNTYVSSQEAIAILKQKGVVRG
jgi:hypothetical protein